MSTAPQKTPEQVRAEARVAVARHIRRAFAEMIKTKFLAFLAERTILPRTRTAYGLAISSMLDELEIDEVEDVQLVNYYRTALRPSVGQAFTVAWKQFRAFVAAESGGVLPELPHYPRTVFAHPLRTDLILLALHWKLVRIATLTWEEVDLEVGLDSRLHQACHRVFDFFADKGVSPEPSMLVAPMKHRDGLGAPDWLVNAIIHSNIRATKGHAERTAAELIEALAETNAPITALTGIDFKCRRAKDTLRTMAPAVFEERLGDCVRAIKFESPRVAQAKIDALVKPSVFEPHAMSEDPAEHELYW